MPELSYTLLRLLPKNTLSRAVGAACRASAPRPVVRAVIRAFARKYGVDVKEAERPIEEYPTFTEFFTRRLKPGMRPIAPGELLPVSPVDGTVGELGDIVESRLYQAKGKHYTLAKSPALPKPVQQPRPPVIVGGIGPRKTPALAARFADEFNYPFPDSVESAAAQFDRVRAACKEADRDPESLRYSAALILCCGRDDAEVKRRAQAIGHDADALRGRHLAGTVAEVVDTIGRYADIGAVRLYMQTLDLSDLDHLELVASEVAPQVG